MSIGPVQNVAPVTENQSAKANLPAERPQTPAYPHGVAEKVAQPGTGNLPKQEGPGTKNLPAPSQLPQDEVQVQWDSQIKDEVVIKYLNTATGDLILQVPSAEVLSVDRGIYQEFQQQAKVKESVSPAPAIDKGEPSHGH
ncbi:MAG TPA: hypothetical protein VKR57_12355 [Terriglobales bacterium]|nr:hypothetical protein [Terriglobales bacterium]